LFDDVKIQTIKRKRKKKKELRKKERL
jgi:hypothetical protein